MHMKGVALRQSKLGVVFDFADCQNRNGAPNERSQILRGWKVRLRGHAARLRALRFGGAAFA
jgi:hypothetical protein